jgi:hypothetical protein
MKITNRSTHRDIAYFYVGLIIAFSFSGILLNHRRDWNPEKYTYESKKVSLNIPDDIAQLDKAFIEDFSKEWEAVYDGHRLRDGQLRVFYKDNAILDADIKTGEGLLEYKRTTPFIGQSIQLHKDTNTAWIWYSDIFGIAMLIIAFTGMFISAGKNTFWKRGWKLALIGLLFPLIFLFFLS